MEFKFFLVIGLDKKLFREKDEYVLFMFLNNGRWYVVVEIVFGWDKLCFCDVGWDVLCCCDVLVVLLLLVVVWIGEVLFSWVVFMLVIFDLSCDSKLLVFFFKLGICMFFEDIVWFDWLVIVVFLLGFLLVFVFLEVEKFVVFLNGKRLILWYFLEMLFFCLR